ncbi:MAG: hypothetical protein J6U89_00115, partial [Bacteroidaceae bacterium]|nr:hypothetical protein [Bacteroidaceae bacterium]
MKKSIIIAISSILTIIVITILLFKKESDSNTTEETTEKEEIAEVRVLKYGLPVDEYAISYDTIKPNQTLAKVLYGFGFTSKQIYELTQCPDSIFDERKIRPGQV